MSLNQQNLEKILFTILEPQIFEQLSLYYFDTIPSTNQSLWELLGQGKIPPLVAIADQQTAGRGQWGHTWQSETGGLYLSVALAPEIVVTDAPHLTISTAWGIADNLRRYNIPVQLKWLNDLILEGRKLGGIKTETRSQQRKITQAVIGVGINWQNPVPATGINLQSFPHSLNSLEALAAITLQGLLSGYYRYLSAGIDSILLSYLELLASLGKSVTVAGGTGIITGVTAQGELRVRLSSSAASTEVCLPPGSISLGYDNS